MVARNPDRIDIEAVVDEGSLVDQALADAAKAARLDHKRSGDPIVVWEDGKVVWIPAEQIEVDPPATGSSARA